MARINVNTLTSVLARMRDEDLQKYAEMHKSDPYVMALAMSESNRRKEMRSAGQGTQEEQPKVVDQMIAGMSPRQPMPEDMGIGAIPAPNMTMAANGGIVGYDEGGMVAFADGGDVERYQVGGLLDSARTRAQAAQQKLYTYGLQQRRQDPEGFETAQQEMTAAKSDLQNAEKNYAAEMSASGINQAAFGVSKTPFYPESTSVTNQDAPRITPTFSADNLSGMDRRLMSGSQPSIPSLKTPLPTKAAPPVGPSRKAPAPFATPATNPSAKPETGGLDSLISKFTRDTDLAIGEGRNARVGFAAALEQIPKDRAARNELARKEESDVFKGREDRLAAREKGIEGMGDKYLGLALLQAGAAMMTTPGGIGMALGKGVQVGSERYVAGIDKINAAKDKFADARDRLEDLRLNRADMTKKDIRDEQRDIDNGVLQAKMLFTDGLNNDLKITAANQRAIFGVVADDFKTTKTLAADAEKTDKLIAGRKAEAGILAAARGDTAGFKGSKVAIDALKAQATNLTNQLKDIVAIPSNAAKRKPLEDQLADINKQLAQLSGLSTMTPPPGVGSAGGTRAPLDSFFK